MTFKKGEPKAVKEKKAVKEPVPDYRPDDYEAVKKRNEGVDMFSRANAYTLHLPSGTVDVFTAKGKYFDVPSRLGSGPCECIRKFRVPNGDFIAPGQTFDPVIERMSIGKFRQLRNGKYFVCQDRDMETKIITHSEKTK